MSMKELGRKMAEAKDRAIMAKVFGIEGPRIGPHKSRYAITPDSARRIRGVAMDVAAKIVRESMKARAMAITIKEAV